MSFVLHPERFLAELVPQRKDFDTGIPSEIKTVVVVLPLPPPEIVAALN